MPFGLSNALASFQSYINKILVKKLNGFVIVYLDDILIYTENKGQDYMKAVQWVLDLLRKNRLFANLKKYQFYHNEICFPRYIMSAQEVQMEDEKIEVIKNWPKPKSLIDIQVFLGFANFYQHFIQNFSKITRPLTSMLGTSPTQLAENLSLLVGMAKDAEVGVSGGNCEDKTGRKSLRSKNSNGVTSYLTPKARLACTQLKKAFTKAPIFRHFDPECHIRIETDALCYAIGGVPSQLTSDGLG